MAIGAEREVRDIGVRGRDDAVDHRVPVEAAPGDVRAAAIGRELELRDAVEKTQRPDALRVDELLAELSMMHARTEMYWRFLKSKIIDDPDAEQYVPMLNEAKPGHFVAEHDPA